MVEEWYAPLTLEADRILVHRENMSTEEESIWVDYISEKVSCPQATEDAPCWMRYAILYHPEEQERPMTYHINGTSISF